MNLRRWIIGVALACAMAVAGYAAVFFDGPDQNYRLWYYTPAAALAGAFMVERWAGRDQGWRRWLVDGLVAAVCLARPLTGYPPLSGHALFVIHALLTCRDGFTRLLAVAVTLLTLYAKIVLWNWDVTLWPGLAAGLVSGWSWRMARARYE